MAPAVAPGPQMRRPRPSVGSKRRRNLGDVEPGECGADDHLGRELHARRVQSQFEYRIAPESAQAAMEIAERDRKEQTAEKAQDGIAEIPVQERHRVTGDPALKSVAHDEIAALAQTRDE